MKERKKEKDNCKTIKIIYSMYRAGEQAASGLHKPTRLEGEVQFIQVKNQQVLPNIVQEW